MEPGRDWLLPLVRDHATRTGMSACGCSSDVQTKVRNRPACGSRPRGRDFPGVPWFLPRRAMAGGDWRRRRWYLRLSDACGVHQRCPCSKPSAMWMMCPSLRGIPGKSVSGDPNPDGPMMATGDAQPSRPLAEPRTGGPGISRPQLLEDCGGLQPMMKSARINSTNMGRK